MSLIKRLWNKLTYKVQTYLTLSTPKENQQNDLVTVRPRNHFRDCCDSNTYQHNNPVTLDIKIHLKNYLDLDNAGIEEAKVFHVDYVIDEEEGRSYYTTTNEYAGFFGLYIPNGTMLIDTLASNCNVRFLTNKFRPVYVPFIQEESLLFNEGVASLKSYSASDVESYDGYGCLDSITAYQLELISKTYFYNAEDNTIVCPYAPSNLAFCSVTRLAQVFVISDPLHSTISRHVDFLLEVVTPNF